MFFKRKIVDYKLVHIQSDDCEEGVQVFLQNGWELYGPPVSEQDYDNYSEFNLKQPMIKYKRFFLRGK